MSEVLKALVRGRDRSIAMIDDGTEYSYADLRALSGRIANALGSLNVPEDARVAALLPNSPEAAAAFLAAVQMGRSYMPLNVGLKASELASLFRKCAIGAVVCRSADRQSVPAATGVVAVDALAAGAPASMPPTVPAEPDPRRGLVCLATSGSTGSPRVAERSAAAVHANTRRIARHLEVTEEDRFLGAVPFWHANGFTNCLMTPLYGGASVLSMERFLPRHMLDLIVERKPTVVVGSPFIFDALARVMEPGQKLSGVRAWISSGAALPAGLDERLRELGIRVMQLYGSSETGTISISAPGEHRPGNVGRPLPGVRVRLVDEAGSEVPPGKTGEVQVSSDALFSKYIGEPGESLPMTADGWYRMADLGEWDNEGNLCLRGRIDAMINVAGVKIDPVEIQRVLAAMPGVERSVVYGVKDVNGMQAVKALLVADEGIDANGVLAHCRAHLAEYKLPRIIEFVDRLPQDLMGKIPRRFLETRP